MAFASHDDDGPYERFQHASFAGLSSPGPSEVRRVDDMQFDIFDWYPHHQSCQRYFLDHAQHSAPVQAVASFINITLPFQRQPTPVLSYTSTSRSPGFPLGPASPAGPAPLSGGGAPVSLPNTAAGQGVSLIPYLRRLVVTGLDLPGVLHGFFGDDWAKGVGALHEQERRNYLFAAKSGGWAAVKKDYDILPLETVPFLRPLRGPTDAEIEAAEKTWSEWLAMEDWMVGPRAPMPMDEVASNRPRASR
ncbi:MAG: hypothetical protein M1838_005234 [Thelocarpon superellum]|nr:MAG: hypothetical protein M1838_005234 [Thelocarpon superellum]